MNAAVHFNSWENLGHKDFEPVVQAYRQLLGGFTCPGCADILRITPDRETREALRCDCGETINLKVRSARS